MLAKNIFCQKIWFDHRFSIVKLTMMLVFQDLCFVLCFPKIKFKFVRALKTKVIGIFNCKLFCRTITSGFQKQKHSAEIETIIICLTTTLQGLNLSSFSRTKF